MPPGARRFYDRGLRLDGAFLTRERGGVGALVAASRTTVSLGAAAGFEAAGASAQRPCTRRQRKLIRVMAQNSAKSAVAN
jgi:hypothetical protein